MRSWNILVLAASLALVVGACAYGITPTEDPAGGDSQDPTLRLQTPDPCEGVVCDDGNPCTADSCVGGECQFDPAPMEHTLCRPSTGACDAAEYCTAGACPADGMALAGTGCADDGDACTRDVCDGAGACVHPAVLCVATFFDANHDGAGDGTALEPLVPGWQIAAQPLGGGAPQFFTAGADGVAVIDLKAGSYQVCALTGGWISTTPSCVLVKFGGDPTESPDVTRHEFGSVCLGAGGGHGLGFWASAEGELVVDAGDVAGVAGLNLRKSDGNPFDPTTYGELQAWLLEANATNMAYMLSAQFAATYLSARNGLLSPYALVHAPGTAGADALGFATIWDVADEANATLDTAGRTVVGSSERAYQTALKDALERVNADRSFVQATFAACTAPLF